VRHAAEAAGAGRLSQGFRLSPVNGKHPHPAPSCGVVHTLHPGDVVSAERGERLETLLGSCVAIILTDRRRTFGAMCHFVHCGSVVSAGQKPGACAGVAVDTLYRLLSRRGLHPKLCEAYVYGGGNMFPEVFKQSHVGHDNGRWALERLARDGVRVLFHDLGSEKYRRLAWTLGPESPHVVAVAV